MVLTDAIKNLGLTFLRETGRGKFILKVESTIFDKLCWEVQKHSGKYVRHHDDGSREEGKTTMLQINTVDGPICIYRNDI